MLKTIILAVGVLISSASQAGMRTYSAPVETSMWEISQQTRLICELEHNIPGYGRASFITEASKQLNLEFNLDMVRLPSRFDTASVYSTPPTWMTGAMQRKLGTMDIRKQYDGDLPEATAWDMLTELEKGYWPTIHYQDWLNSQDSVAVSLNASNFSPEYHQFNACVDNLLRYSFDDIAYTVLSYKKNSSELSKYSQSRLDMIGEYLKEDIDLELVLVDGYTDSYGGSWLNEQLSIKRASEIKDFFASMGVNPERIEVTGHGEKRHSSPNDNTLEREKNRRVVIRMSKP
ncbi:flagellar protein MotY [Glaciecola sp. 2405UD65-10]|uniref:flagellar protein MotY n=1 Tax=Glaciecola sp. 2405UD65-10 TaxID=3397244 RepID=UPI003B5BA1D9